MRAARAQSGSGVSRAVISPRSSSSEADIAPSKAQPRAASRERRGRARRRRPRGPSPAAALSMAAAPASSYRAASTALRYYDGRAEHAQGPAARGTPGAAPAPPRPGRGPWRAKSRRSLAARRAAATSSGALISSIASTCGFMERSSMAAPRRLSTPVSTSVCAPTSNTGVPSSAPATSPRSSSSDTRHCAEARRTSSRSSVVFAPAGGESSSVSGSPPSASCGQSAEAQPSGLARYPQRHTAQPPQGSTLPPALAGHPAEAHPHASPDGDEARGDLVQSRVRRGLSRRPPERSPGRAPSRCAPPAGAPPPAAALWAASPRAAEAPPRAAALRLRQRRRRLTYPARQAAPPRFSKPCPLMWTIYSRRGPGICRGKSPRAPVHYKAKKSLKLRVSEHFAQKALCLRLISFEYRGVIDAAASGGVSLFFIFHTCFSLARRFFSASFFCSFRIITAATAIRMTITSTVCSISKYKGPPTRKISIIVPAVTSPESLRLRRIKHRPPWRREHLLPTLPVFP